MIRSLDRDEDRRLRYLSQKATITGLGIADFTRCIENISAIENIFKRVVGEETIVPWASGKYGEWFSIDAACRLFTDSRRRPNLQSVPFEGEEDPTGSLLNSLVARNLVHCEDNKVYYSRTTECMT